MREPDRIYRVAKLAEGKHELKLARGNIDAVRDILTEAWRMLATIGWQQNKK